jgi:hypothetical protein
MNEEELKQIWNKDKAAVAPAIDFEAVQKNMRGWEGKLRRKIKIDIITNAAAYVLLIPAAVYYPEILYLAPFMILVWVWYLWETLRIYRQETNSSESGSTKEYLETKKRFWKTTSAARATLFTFRRQSVHSAEFICRVFHRKSGSHPYCWQRS